MNTQSQAAMGPLKISPAGLITLPSAARKVLGADRGMHPRLEVSVSGDSVRLSLAGKGTTRAVRVSPGGILQLPERAHQALTSRDNRRYECLIEGSTIHLRPAKTSE